MSSSDDEMPLSMIRNSGPEKPKIKKEAITRDDSSDDEVPLSVMVSMKKQAMKVEKEQLFRNNGRPKRTAAPDSLKEADIKAREEESDDDVPLSSLKRKSAPKKKKSTSSSSSKRTKTSSSSSAPKRKSSSSTSVKLAISDGESSATRKHALAESILRRASYCLPLYPPKKDMKPPRKNYIACGFNQVYVGVAGDEFGKLVDKREDHELKPCLSGLLKVESEELKSMLVGGISKQIQDLKEQARPGVVSVVLPNLEKELKKASVLKTKPIDKEYKMWVRTS